MKQFLAGAVFGLCGAALLLPAAKAANTADYAGLDLLANVIERVHANYVREISVSDLAERAVEGMLSSLDPHSSYADPQAFAAMRLDRSGDTADVGLTIRSERGEIRVLSTMGGSPAALGGIKADDFILAVDGHAVTGLPANTVDAMLRGPGGSKITLAVQQKFATQPADITLTRILPPAQSLFSERRGNVGYIRIASFSTDTETALAAAIAKLKKAIGPDLKGYIVDLRDNAGGLLDTSIAASDDFLETGQIVALRGRPGDALGNQTYAAKAGDIAEGKPIIVLIDGGTAAGSEIMAAALQDQHRATIMGEKSQGQGTIQTIIPVPGGGVLRLTTASFYRPSGGGIDGNGIVPDVVVAPASGAPDAQLAAALSRMTAK